MTLQLQPAFALALLTPLLFGQSQQKKTDKPEYYDEPHFTVAGMTDYTYRGGHGSDAVLRSTEALTKATAALGDVDRNPENALEAVRAYQRAAELNPSESNLFNLGAELLKHHASDAAIGVFTKGNRLFPHSSRMLLGLATAFYARGSYDDAARYFFAAANLNPHDPEPYLFLGQAQAHEITGSDRYLKTLKRFTEIQPDNAWASYYYAVALWNRRTDDHSAAASAKARLLLEKAVRLDPRLSEAYLALGVIEADQKNLLAAISAFKRAIEIAPQLEEAHYRLSQAYALSGNKTEAQKELALYTELSKKSTEQRERERAQLQQFVITLKSPDHPQ